MSLIATLTLNPAVDLTTSTPHIEPTRKLRCTPPTREPGGGGINVARVVQALGGQACAVYPAGGTPGEQLEHMLATMNLPRRAVPIAGDTRESFTVDAQDSGEQYRFVLPGPTLSAAEQQACLDTLASLCPLPGWLVLSGSFPPGVAPDFIDRMQALARRIGARLVLDCSGAPLAHAAGCRGIHLMKPSLSELEGLCGHALPDKATREAAAMTLVERGVSEVVVLSLGEDGAILASRAGIRHYAACQVPLRSAVGAGDSMVGAIVTALDRGLGLEEAVCYGVAAGSATIMQPGSGLCRLADVEALHARGCRIS